jgi:hypothetical protein
MWSATSTAAETLQLSSESSAKDETARFATLYYDWEEATPGPGSSAQKDSSQHEEEVEMTDLIGNATVDWDESKNGDESASTTSAALFDDLPLVPKKSITEAHIHRHSVSTSSNPVVTASPDDKMVSTDPTHDSLATDLHEWRSLFIPQTSEPLRVVPGGCAVEVSVICHRHAVSPSVNFERGILLTSDGLSVIIDEQLRELTSHWIIFTVVRNTLCIFLPAAGSAPSAVLPDPV